jgi:hypothetical protein
MPCGSCDRPTARSPTTPRVRSSRLGYFDLCEEPENETEGQHFTLWAQQGQVKCHRRAE